MSFTKRVKSTTPPSTPFTESVVGTHCPQKRATAKDTLQSALHTVQLRVHQLVMASFKAHKLTKATAISHQLHELSAYEGLLHQLSDSLASGSNEVCLNSFMTTVSHVTGRIQHSMFDYSHEADHHDEHPFSHVSFFQGLEHQSTHVSKLIHYGTTLNYHARAIKKAAVDFDVTIMTAAAAESGDNDLRNEAKEALRIAVTSELICEGIVAAASANTPQADEQIHKTAKQRWKEIKIEATKIHEAAKTGGGSLRSAINDLYARKVQPHIDAWKNYTAERVPEEFADSAQNMNYFIEGLNNAAASFPSQEVQTLQAFHENISSMQPRCDHCINILGDTLDALKAQKEAIDAALHTARNLDKEGLPKTEFADMIPKTPAVIKSGHEEHLPPEIDEATRWLKDSLKPLQEALNALGISKESGKEVS